MLGERFTPIVSATTYSPEEIFYQTYISPESFIGTSPGNVHLYRYHTDFSLRVLVGAENSVRTLADRLWRRVA
jgi:hypothetical protein